jgi:hypothetical protein
MESWIAPLGVKTIRGLDGSDSSDLSGASASDVLNTTNIPADQSSSVTFFFWTDQSSATTDDGIVFALEEYDGSTHTVLPISELWMASLASIEDYSVSDLTKYGSRSETLDSFTAPLVSGEHLLVWFNVGSDELSSGNTQVRLTLNSTVTFAGGCTATLNGVFSKDGSVSQG